MLEDAARREVFPMELRHGALSSEVPCR
jgi:hypothetical protein